MPTWKLLLVLVFLVSAIHAQNVTEVVSGQQYSGQLMHGQYNMYSVVITNCARQMMVFAMISPGATINVKYGSPPSSPIDYDSTFCVGFCFGAPQVYWIEGYESITCPGPFGTNQYRNGTYYFGFQNTQYNTSYSFTLTLEDPLLQLGVARQYPINSQYMFYVNANTVDSSTTLEIHQTIVHIGVSSGTANAGLQLFRSDNCNFPVAPFNDITDQTSLVYSLTSSTAIKNTDAFFVSPQCGYAVLIAGKTGLLQPGNSFCVVMCESASPDCHACDSAGTGGMNSAFVPRVSALLAAVPVLGFVFSSHHL